MYIVYTSTTFYALKIQTKSNEKFVTIASTLIWFKNLRARVLLAKLHPKMEIDTRLIKETEQPSMSSQTS